MNNFTERFADSISTNHRLRLLTYGLALVILTPAAVVLDVNQVPEAIILGLICGLIPVIAIGAYAFHAKDLALPIRRKETHEHLKVRALNLKNTCEQQLEILNRQDDQLIRLRVLVIKHKRAFSKRGESGGVQEANKLLEGLQSHKAECRALRQEFEEYLKEADSVLSHLDDLAAKESQLRILERKLKALMQQEKLTKGIAQISQMFKQLEQRQSQLAPQPQ